MGWVATVGIPLIVAVVVYGWYNNINNGEKDMSLKIEAAGSARHSTSSPAKKVAQGERTREEDEHGSENETGEGIAQSTTNQSSVAVVLTEAEPSPRTEQKGEEDGARGLVAPSSVGKLLSQSTLPVTNRPSPRSTTAVKTMAAPALRSGGSSPPRLKPPTFGGLAPSPTTRPTPPRPNGTSRLRPPPSAASSLRVPPTKVLSGASMAPSPSPSPSPSSLSPSTMMPPPLAPPAKKASKKVTLEPGHSPLDWAALVKNPQNTPRLRGKDFPYPDGRLVRVTPTQLRAQNGRRDRDAWTVYQGRVYNITPYVPFHPGGKGEILRGAGKDSARLFMEVHPWVNWDGMLAECCVGILVGDEDEVDDDRDGSNTQTGNALDEMD